MAGAYQVLRGILLEAVLKALDVDLTAFKERKGPRLQGPCPVCRPKKNKGNFSANQDGRWHCFGCKNNGTGGD